jgi:ribonuclease P protein component
LNFSEQKFRFKNGQRLANSNDFKRVFDSPDIRVGSDHLLILARQNEDLEQSARLGLVVAKKKLRTAVKRNRFKRRTRETFRLHQAALSGFDYVVIARKGGQDLNDIEFLKEMNSCWIRVIRKIQRN